MRGQLLIALLFPMAYFTRSYVSFHPQNCALVLQVCSTTEAEAVDRAIRAEESLRETEEALRQLKSWYDSAVGRLAEVCAERRRLRVELTSLREQHQQEQQAASARICELERQVTALTTVVAEEFARVRELWHRIEAAEQERLAAQQVVAQQAPAAAQSPSAASLLWCLLLLVLGVCFTVATQR